MRNDLSAWLTTRVSRTRVAAAMVGIAAAAAAAVVVVTAVLVWAPAAHAEVATWGSAPAEAPPPPAGVAPAPYPVPLGEVGEISFWAPNRGLLITGGTEGPGKGPVAPGVYAYDGATWHQLSTVCGGAEGRIAWAGPDDFWTISDQRAGQVLPPSGSGGLQSKSLCHFLNGAVVGSYALPLAEADSYLHMDAAACYGPSDCWFGGQAGSTPNVGAFHLHWDGETVTAVYEPEDHAVTSMVNLAGELYESVQIGGGDAWLPSENQRHPAILHTIAPAGVAPTFEDAPIFVAGEALPDYGKGVLPDALQGFDLASDGGPLGAGATQLWAAANPVLLPPVGSQPASLTVLRCALQMGACVWSQMELQLPRLAGSQTQVDGTAQEQGVSGAIAPEPGSESAWLSLAHGAGHGATVARVSAAGQVEQTDLLPLASEPEPVGDQGEAGPIVCPAAHDCWLATVSGWLFHYSDGAQYPRNTDPFFDGEDGVITSRPPDSGVPVIYPDLPPVDDSLAGQQLPPAPVGPPAQTPAPPVQKAKPLLIQVKSRLVRHRLLVVSFTLTARAHVQLIARRHKRVVARTREESLKPGRHQLSLSLSPARWPTGTQFKATPIGGAPAGSAPSGPAGSPAGGSAGGNTIET